MSDEHPIGKRFSAHEFGRLGLDSEDAAMLALESNKPLESRFSPS